VCGPLFRVAQAETDVSVGSPENWQYSTELPLDCNNVPGGNAQILACGCNDDTSCRDCEGTPNGTKQDLNCGCGNPAPGECGCEECPAEPPPCVPWDGTYYGDPDDVDTTICMLNPNVDVSSVIKPDVSTGWCRQENTGWWADVWTEYGNCSSDMTWARDDIGTPSWTTASGDSQYCYYCGQTRIFGCFAPATKITMSDQTLKAIEAISVGDMVWNPKANTAARVERIIEGPENLPLIEYGFGSSISRVSQQHPVLTAAGLKTAAELTVEDSVYGADGKPNLLTTLRRAPVEDGQIVINIVIKTENAGSNEHYLLADGIVTGDLILQQQLRDKAGK